MALVVSSLKRRKLGTMQVSTGTVAFDTTYPAGGEAFTHDMVGFSQEIEMADFGEPCGGHVILFDRVNQKAKVYYGDYSAGADGVLVENAVADISALTAVPFIAWGK